jgi:Photosynthetic reaction centre cytochrome C subunit
MAFGQMIALVFCVVAAASTTSQNPVATPTPAVAEAKRPSPDEAKWQKEALDGIRQYISGRETEPAEAVFKNIELLRGKPASRLPGMMSALTGLLGVTCAECHVPGHWESDEKPGKRTARLHFQMQADLNHRYFGDANAITCWTCHRGSPKPASLP